MNVTISRSILGIRQLRCYSCQQPGTRHHSATANDSRRRILYHYFKQPVPYSEGLALQERLVSSRVAAKVALQEHEDGVKRLTHDEYSRQSAVAAEDIVLLLQHRPVYTTGRRDTDPDLLRVEGERLTAIGADYIATQRGGQTTYHGPGQLVGYPIMDTFLLNMSTRQFVEAITSFLEHLMTDRLKIPLVLPPPHVGVYPSATTKIASIGIQIRHRVTSHGFALNVTDEVKYWFDQIIACGNADIKATSIESELQRLGSAPEKRLEVEDVVPKVVAQLESTFIRPLVPLEHSHNAELYNAVVASQ